MFEVSLQDLSFLDLRFEFLVNNYVYNRLETSGNPNLINKSQKLVSKKFVFNLISGLQGM